jgi:uncharacterized protein YndB with AHSA1/START domain
MKPTTKTTITVQTNVHAPIEKVWQFWTTPVHIIHWNNASDDWHTPYAENNLKKEGKFKYRMEAKDGSAGFDFEGAYTEIITHKRIEYGLADGRAVQISFGSKGEETVVTETFEAEQTNSVELQQGGWQAILDNFKNYVEKPVNTEKLHFEIHIKAPVEKVYQTMLDKEHYSVWTAEFNPTSYFVGSWEKGSKIVFLGTDKDGNQGGMVSRIRQNVPNKFVSIEHLGLVQNGKEILTGPEIEQWAGALEEYTFTETNGATKVEVDMDSNEEFKSYFIDTWPRALKKLKTICE